MIRGQIPVFLHEFTANRGKPAVLKDLVAYSVTALLSRHPTPGTRHILLFTDANTHFRPGALRKLVRHFREPSVGGVCGRLVLTHRKPDPEAEGEGRPSPASVSPPEGFYWNLETALKRRESDLDSCLGANGAIYAIRPELFWKDLPANTVVDDLVIGMKVREQGFRVVYEPQAIAEEELPQQRDEWARRVRIGSGDYQAAVLCRRCLSPRFGWFAWAFLSHKLLRWFTPHAMILTAILSAIGSLLSIRAGRASWLFHGVSLAVLLLLVAWAVSRLASASSREPGTDNRQPAITAPLRLLDHFLTMQLALFVGFLRFCRGELGGAWARTPRGEATSGGIGREDT